MIEVRTQTEYRDFEQRVLDELHREFPGTKFVTADSGIYTSGSNIRVVRAIAGRCDCGRIRRCARRRQG